MRFTVETTSAIPIYAQIIEQVKRAIATGVLRAGDSLPSLRELAGQLRVNPLTVAKAYRELEAQGIVVTEHGRGTTIAPNVVRLSEAYRRDALRQAVDRLLVEAYHLGATPEEIHEVLDELLDDDTRLPAREENAK